MSDPEAGLARLREMLRSYPEQLAAAAEHVQGLKRQTVTGVSADGHVTVTADGHGQITGISFSATALRRLDTQTLGERLAEAVNIALEEAERLQNELRGRHDTTTAAAFEEIEEVFNHRISSLMQRLDEIDRSLG